MGKESDEAYGAVYRLINSMGGDAKDFARRLACNLHRTLQQAFMREVILEFCKTLAENEEFCDKRNEASIKLAKRIMQIVEEEGHYLPFV